jgi:hypothetical protein
MDTEKFAQDDQIVGLASLLNFQHAGAGGRNQSLEEDEGIDRIGHVQIMWEGQGNSRGRN